MKRTILIIVICFISSDAWSFGAFFKKDSGKKEYVSKKKNPKEDNGSPPVVTPPVTPPTTPDPVDPPITEPDEPDETWYQPTTGTTWNWQLQGSINTSYKVDLYDIDLFDTSSAKISSLQSKGIKVICYFSAGSSENWRSDYSKFKSADKGKNLDGWDGEKWLDIRSSNVRSIMKARLDLAVEKNCDGVEPDNVDGYQNNTGFGLNYNDQISYNKFLAEEAHKRNLSIALKNDVDQVDDLVDYFDFTVNEECFEYNECSRLSPFKNQNKAILNAEYNKDKSVCSSAHSRGMSTLLLDYELDDSYRYSCD